MVLFFETITMDGVSEEISFKPNYLISLKYPGDFEFKIYVR